MSASQQARNILEVNCEPEEKVYRIARLLRKEGDIDPYLWYAILELKEKFFLGNKLKKDDRIDE